MSRNDMIPPTPGEEAYRVDEDQGDVFTRDAPLALFSDWFARACEREVNDPNAFSLATVDADGAPDVRVVLLKDFDDRGFSFYTNTESAKGAQLAVRPVAAAVFHWKTLRRQVRLRGPVEPVGPAEADAYFAERARGARIGAWASAQSRALEGPEALAEAIAATEARFEGEDVPRPPHWNGYRLKPQTFEFWVNRPYRLHDRLVFEREGDGWATRRLYP